MNEFKGCAITMLNTFLLMLIALLAFSSESQAAVWTEQKGTFKQCTSPAGAKKYNCIEGTGCPADTLKCVPPVVVPPPTCPAYTTGTPPNCIPIPCGPGFTGNQPNCTPIPPISTIITYPDGRPSIDTAKIPPPAVGYSDLRLKPTTEQPVASPDDKGAVRILIGYSHMNFDDALIYPGQQGKAHLHTYFGNTGANYLSTPESIRTTGNSTAQGGIMNRSAYWIPAMIDTATNAPLTPIEIQVYYKHSTVIPIPRGLRMISGDMHRSTSFTPSWERSAYFECNNVYSNKQDNIIPCGKDSVSTMVVAFPACWNGRDLDSPNHKDHMAFTTNGACPTTHPVKLPTITIKAYYKVTTDAGTANWRLSSDMYGKNGYNAGYSAHADFIMGWDEVLHKVLVDKCINAQKDCHSHLTGDGRYFY
jgi:hypothetical protein